MSLFRARELWSSTNGNDEVFDQGSICIANIDQNSDGKTQIVTGSHFGILRIYCPNADKNDDGAFIGSKPEHLLLEVQLSQPILQVVVGRFVSSSVVNHLAILHPRKLFVCTVSSVPGATEYGSQYQLEIAYEHNLQRSAYNLTYGPFGGVKGRDFFCIQSLDGTVSFFEQDSFAFCRFLPKFLLPGPIQYVRRTDSFVTVSSSYQLECYKYQVLAVAADSKTKEESQNIKQGKKVSMDWFYNLGEQAVDICVSNFKNSIPSIFVLGERHIFCLKDTGVLRFLIKLDYSPSAFLPYQADADGSVMYMVTTHTKTLLIYKDVTLQWAAQIPVVPVNVSRATIGNVLGAICLLSDEGNLLCMYLGTDPSLFTAPICECIDFNYNETDKELAELYKIIRASQKPAGTGLQFLKILIFENIKSIRDDSSKQFMTMEVSIDDRLIPLPDHVKSVLISCEDKLPCAHLKIKLQPKCILNNVRVSVTVQKPLEASQKVSDYQSISQEVEISCYIFMKHGYIPSILKANVIVVYASETGAQRVANRVIDLPFDLFAKPSVPCKDSSHKITIEVKHSIPPLNQIFPEYVQENSDTSTSSIGFHIYGGPDVAIFTAKSSNRYRIQSNTHEAMWLGLQQLTKRLHEHWGQTIEGDNCPLYYTGQLPLKECFKLIDGHHESRLMVQKYQDELTQGAAQFRAIQKRLLAKFRDKTPSPLTNLDVLLESTYNQVNFIIEITYQMEIKEIELQELSCSLSASICLLQELIRMQTGLDLQKFNLLCSALSSYVPDHMDQVGWEELTDAAVNYLLKTCLGKPNQDHKETPTNLTFLKDVTTLKRHISQLVEKITNKAGDLSVINENISGELHLNTELLQTIHE
ncbi:Protein PTHB1 [Nymphon striatum]|nr:Protein PTHB1 [Nymphon striatum]